MAVFEPQLTFRVEPKKMPRCRVHSLAYLIRYRAPEPNGYDLYRLSTYRHKERQRRHRVGNRDSPGLLARQTLLWVDHKAGWELPGLISICFNNNVPAVESWRNTISKLCTDEARAK